MVEINLF